MPFDSVTLAAALGEARQRLVGGRLSKIHQPQALALVLTVRSERESIRLLLSAHPTQARVHITEAQWQNPATPPPFCMLLRRHLEGGRVLDVRQPGRERIAQVLVGTRNELGDPVTLTLVAEVMGKNSNLILVGDSGRILDAARRVGEDRNRFREVLPGLPYIPPPATGKPDLAEVNAADLLQRAALRPEQPVWQLLLDSADGIGPLLARELCARAAAPATARDLTAATVDALAAAGREMAAAVAAARFAPALLFSTDGQLTDYCALPLTHWPGRVVAQPGMSLALDHFYSVQEEAEQRRRLHGELGRAVTTAQDRLQRRVALLEADVAQAEDAEGLRIAADILMAHLAQVPRGAASVTLPDFYAEGEGTRTIAVNPALSPQANAQAYFRRYRKAKSGLAALRERLAATRDDITYLEQTALTLAATAALPELAELKRELVEQGFLAQAGPQPGRRPGRSGAGGGPGGAAATSAAGAAATAARRRAGAGAPLVLRSRDGLEIWVGRNNRQNDELTLRLAAAGDLWFHTKEIAGAHVILRVPPGSEPPDTSLLEAAVLAAFHSRARRSAQVPVDYTQRRHVRKPSGARPGLVIYDRHRTLYVTPDPEQHPVLRQALPADAAPDPLPDPAPPAE